jgi:hypothetical protein
MSFSVDDKKIRYCIRGSKKSCKIEGCKIRGRYNYGKEYFYHGFCKKHYSQYQEGIIDFHGNSIRPSLQGIKNLDKYNSLRKIGRRWNKQDHIDNNLRCKICGCERDGEISHGKMRYFKGMCSYHYRKWYLKGFMDESGSLIIGIKGEKKNEYKSLYKNNIITRKLVRQYKNSN